MWVTETVSGTAPRGIDREEGERVILRTPVHVLPLCKFNRTGSTKLQVKLLSPRTSAAVWGAETMGEDAPWGSAVKRASASYCARSRTSYNSVKLTAQGHGSC